MTVLVPSLSRRQLLALMALSPLCLSVARSRAATLDLRRVVALEWLPVELLLALGVIPYGIADAPGYRIWVNEPALPDNVIDVGLRTEPNLELLASMRPSCIVWSAGYGPSEDKLARIAPGRGFVFSDGKQPLSMARRSLHDMAEMLNLRPAAQAHLDHFDQFMDSLKPRFAGRGKRPVLLMTLLESRHALVMGNNSLFQQVMDIMGIENAWHGEMSFWGSTVVGLERLAAIKDADVLCFDHNNDADMTAIARTPLWQALPFVREQRFQRVPATWYYGATLSAMHFARVLDKALGGKI